LKIFGIIMKKPENPPSITGFSSYEEIISELTKLNKSKKFFEIEENEYPYWEEWKYKAKDWEISQSKIWSAAKLRRLSRNSIHLSDVTGFTFYFNTPSIIQKYLHELDLNLGGNLQSDAIIPAQEKDRYLISSIMEEAIASSQIEGAVTTRKIAKEMLEKKRSPKNKSEQMILNNYTTMKWIVDNRNTEMTEVLLLKIHQLITHETLDNKADEGSFRTNDNIKVMDETNEVFYIPPECKYILELIREFCVLANDESRSHGFIHPIVKAITLHFLIGYIHPFVDGNGRTARAIFYWYLIKKGYWLIEYMSVSRIILRAKAQYARAYLYTEYDENDLTYFIIYNLKAIKTALEDLKLHIQHKNDEKKKVLSLIKNTSFNERQIVLVKDIMQDKTEYFTVAEVEQRFGVSNQTARNDLTNLVNNGILSARQSGRKIHFFAADGFEQKLMK